MLSWAKESVKYVGKIPGYGLTLSHFIKVLRKHAPKTPRPVGEIYLEIPHRIMRGLPIEADDVKETVRILYKKRHKSIADAICNQFEEIGLDFLRELYEEYQC